MAMKDETNPAVVADNTTQGEPAAEATKPKRERKASSTKKETTVTTKKKAKAKAKTKGGTPFRPGTKKEAAFIAFKTFHKDYAKLERGAKGEWAEKAAKKHGVEVTTMKSWIGGDFSSNLPG